MASTAVSKVLIIPELSELILSHLHIYQLLKAANATPLFRALLTASPILQRTITLEPELAQRPLPRSVATDVLRSLANYEGYFLDLGPFTVASSELVIHDNHGNWGVKLWWEGEVSSTEASQRVTCRVARHKNQGGTWRNVRVSGLPLRVGVIVNGSGGAEMYRVEYRLGEGENTLGDIAGCLEEVMVDALEL